MNKDSREEEVAATFRITDEFHIRQILRSQRFHVTFLIQSYSSPQGGKNSTRITPELEGLLRRTVGN